MQTRTRSAIAMALLGVAALASSGCLDRELKALNPCLVSGVARKVVVTNVDFVDLLFVVDNSGSMRQEQGALRDQFPKLINTLTSGRQSDGKTFPPVKDMNLGVVSTDMGLVNVPNSYPSCNTMRHLNGGDDGVLLHPGNTGPGCKADYPPFLQYKQTDDPAVAAQLATDFGCIANLGTTGCGFEQQLEAGLKALWPREFIDAKGDKYLPEQNKIKFLSTTEAGRYGHGDVPVTQGGNAPFLRNDPQKGLSLIAIIIVSDEEDCSSRDTGHFAETRPDAASPLAAQPINLRCYHNKQNLYDIQRYVTGFQELRPGAEQLVIYGAIVGVPKELVSKEAREGVDMSDQASRDLYYDTILNHPDMIETPVDETLGGRPNPMANLKPSCRRTDAMGDTAEAYPPVRMVQVAKAIGKNAVVQSICQDNFDPAMDAIIDVIAEQLGAVCLPRAIVRKSSGEVGCNVVWELPPPNTAPDVTPTTCNDPRAPWLNEVDPGRAPINDRKGNNCKVTQLPVLATNTVPQGDGWYYDDFSDEVKNECAKNQPQRVSFSLSAKPPTGVTVKLECLNETQKLSNTRLDIRENQPEVGDECTQLMDNMMPMADDSKCHIDLKDNTQDTSMFCHPKLNVCVQGCMGDSQCPDGWVCDTREMSVADTMGKGAYCTNPTCGSQE